MPQSGMTRVGLRVSWGAGNAPPRSEPRELPLGLGTAGRAAPRAHPAARAMAARDPVWPRV